MTVQMVLENLKHRTTFQWAVNHRPRAHSVRGRTSEAAPTTHRESRKEAGNSVPGRFAGLSQRERELVALVADGLDNHTIADKLYLSEGTVRNRISSILAKTNLSNRTQLAIEWLSSRES